MHPVSGAFSFLGILVILAGVLFVFTPPAEAGRVSPAKTNLRHLDRSPEQPRWRLKRTFMQKRTRYVNPAKRGLMFEDDQSLGDISSVDRGATKACRAGNFRRYGGGFVRVGGATYRAARSLDIKRPSGFSLRDGVYVFTHEGSSRCTVYLVGDR